MEAREALRQVLVLFCNRFGLKREPYDSVGAAAIQEAMESDTPDIAGLRKLLTEEYTLYPQYESRILALLDQIKVAEVPASVTVEEPEGIPAPEPTEGEVEEEPKPKTARFRSKRIEAGTTGMTPKGDGRE